MTTEQSTDGLVSGDATAENLAYYERESPGQEDYWRFMAAPRARIRILLGALARSSPRSLVDLGCGRGLLLDEVRERFPSASLAGIDLSPRLLESNRRRLPSVEWITADLSRPIDRPKSRYEVVVASEVIEHVGDPLVFLENARRLAEPGGRLLLSTQSGPLRATERAVGHQRHFSDREMRDLLLESGWRPDRVWNYGWPFHDLSKWWANRDADRTLTRFGDRPYGWRERLVCAGLRALFRLNSHRRGAQLFAEASTPADRPVPRRSS